MSRAVYVIGRDPPRPDPLRQVIVDADTAVDPEDVALARRAIAIHLQRMNERDAERASEAA